MNRLSICIYLFAVLSPGVFFAANEPLQAQIFGIPTASEDQDSFAAIAKIAPAEEPLACWIWNRAGNLNPDGNPGEQWLADEGLQNSLGKLKLAIGKLADMQQSETLVQLSKKIGWLLASKAGIAAFENVDMEGESLIATIAIKLDGDRQEVGKFLESAMAEFEITGETKNGAMVYPIPNIPFPVFVGIQQDHLILAAGQNQWDAIRTRIGGPEEFPGWMKDRLKNLPLDRRSQFAFASIRSFMAMLPPEAEEDENFQRISKALDLQGLKSIALSSGADGVSNVSMFHVECNKEGLGAIMNVPAIEKSKLEELPAEAVSAVALRFSPGNMMSLIDQTVPQEELEDFLSTFAEASGLDLRADIIDHLEGTVRTYQTGSVMAPKQVMVIRIRDEAEFASSYEQINATLEQMAAEMGMEFIEQEKRGKQIFGIANFGVAAYWSVQGSNLYLASNSRAIGSHIRKAEKGNFLSVLETELGAKVLAQAKSLELEGPLFVQHFDLDQIVEVVIPVVQGLMNFIPPEAAEMFEFGAEDFPLIESLLGLRPSSSMLFKNSDGYMGISRYDTPVPFELSTVAVGGIAVGLLLPAVQQVRAAARRTQSMNNLRQLSLACLNYEASKRSYPAAYTVDEEGKPLLSWRVAILPYLGEQELYDQFRQDEPWDSDHNRQLLSKMPDVFRNPAAFTSDTDSSYAAPVCEGSAIAEKANTIENIEDGAFNTILVVELGESQQMPWTAPQDLDISKLTDLEFDNGHPGVILFARCDGAVHSISKTVDLDEFLKACNGSDGSSIDALLKR